MKAKCLADSAAALQQLLASTLASRPTVCQSTGSQHAGRQQLTASLLVSSGACMPAAGSQLTGIQRAGAQGNDTKHRNTRQHLDFFEDLQGNRGASERISF